MSTSTRILTLSSTVIAFAFVAGSTSEARADRVEACGGVWFDSLAEGSCEVLPTEECKTECEPPVTINVCASRLVRDCDTMCTATAEVECQSSCVETCSTDCEATTSTEVSCSGSCMADCQGDANGACEGAEGDECDFSATHCCAAECEGQCEATVDQEVSCDTTCDTACHASCEARANLDCQVTCQAERFTECETEVVQECKEECETTGAAIFCDGQFLASAGDLEACANDLEDHFGFSLDVNIDVDVDGECHDNSCEVEGEGEGDGKLGCFSTIDPQGRTPRGFGWAMLVMFGIGATRLRRVTRRA